MKREDSGRKDGFVHDLIERFCKICGFSIKEYPLPNDRSKVCMISGKDKHHKIDLACVFRKHGDSSKNWQWIVGGEDKIAKADALILENGILWCDELRFSTSLFGTETTIDLSCVNSIESLEIWLDLHDGKA